jgi:hypothetical protein
MKHYHRSSSLDYRAQLVQSNHSTNNKNRVYKKYNPPESLHLLDSKRFPVDIILAMTSQQDNSDLRDKGASQSLLGRYNTARRDMDHKKLAFLDFDTSQFHRGQAQCPSQNTSDPPDMCFETW